MSLKLAVIICTKNRSADLDITLNSIFFQTLMPDTLLIVDDSNNDATEKITEKYSSYLRTNVMYLHSQPMNSGLPAARNFGIKNVPDNTDIIVFLDDDVSLDPPYLEAIQKSFISSPDVVGVGGFIHEGYHNRRWYEKPILAMIGFLLPTLVPVSLSGFRLTKTGVALQPMGMHSKKNFRNAEWLSGCNMAYRKSVFCEGNFFDEHFVRYAFGEDILFSHQLYKKGGKIVITKEARLKHRISPEDRLPSKSNLTMLFGYRKYSLQKFSGDGLAGRFYFRWFTVHFFLSALVLSLIKKNNFSYFKNTVEAYNDYTVFEKKIEKNDLESFNALFKDPIVSYRLGNFSKK